MTSVATSVVAPPSLASYCLPAPPDGPQLRAAVEALICILDVTSDSVTVPLLASIFAAPLGPWLKLDYTLWVYGPTGVLKTSLAKVLVASFGAGGEAISGWSSTPLSLQKTLARAKNVPALVDNMKVRGTVQQVADATANVIKIIEAQADKNPRSAMHSDGTDRPIYIPSGGIIATAEYKLECSESARARMVLLRMERDRCAGGQTERATGQGSGLR